MAGKLEEYRGDIEIERIKTRKDMTSLNNQVHNLETDNTVKRGVIEKLGLKIAELEAEQPNTLGYHLTRIWEIISPLTPKK